MKHKKLRTVLFYIGIVIILVYFLFPFYWAVVSSLRPSDQLFSPNQALWPTGFNYQTYIQVFTGRPFARNILNSTIVAGFSTLLCLVIGSFAGYAIARLKFPGKLAVMIFILMVSMFPQVSILGALFQILRTFKLINTYPGLIIPYIALTLPLTAWTLQNFFRDLPRELEESAYIDGSGKFSTFWKIILPLATPGLVATGLLTFIFSWNEFLFALSFEQLPNMYTIPVAISMFSGYYVVPWGQIMAASVLVTVPLITLVLIFQNRIIAGMTAGSVKG